MKIAFIGTGLMGFPMAKNLLEKSLDLNVFSRTIEKAKPLKKFGAKISRESIPISDIAKKFLTDNPNKIKFSDILSWGDDYELLFTSFKKNRNKLLTLAKKNKVKISLVGSIINKTGIYDDSLRPIINTNSFDHFC